MISTILDVAFLLRAKLSGNELDLALIAATNDENWQAAPALLHAISSAAYSHEKWERIRDFLWAKLRKSSRWKKVLKALNVVEFMLKNGPMFGVDQLKKQLAFFRALESFHAEEDGIDRGASIRQRGRIVVGLLQNQALLQDERASAKLIRERMSHMAGTTSFTSEGKPQNSAPKYESYNSKSLENTEDNKAFYNYGSGNYGDRQEDVQHQKDAFRVFNRGDGEKRVREVVPIFFLDFQQRKVQENPLYQEFRKRNITQNNNNSEIKNKPNIYAKQKKNEKIEKKPERVQESLPNKSNNLKQKISEVMPEVVSQKPSNIIVSYPQLPNLFTEGLKMLSPLPTTNKALQSTFSQLQLLSLNPFADPPANSSKTSNRQQQVKNGSNFEVQKIAWLSNNEKNLTDLTDLPITKKTSQPKQKKQFTNNIKIDPWAW